MEKYSNKRMYNVNGKVIIRESGSDDYSGYVNSTSECKKVNKEKSFKEKVKDLFDVF